MASKLKINEIQIDLAYQRKLEAAQVKKIFRRYDENAFGIVTVGRRSDGSLWCVDGQHRMEAANQLGFKTVPVKVFQSEGQKHEADLYLKLNEHRAATTLGKLKADVTSGNVEAVKLVEEIRLAGFRVAFENQSAWPYISCVGQLDRAHREGVLSRVLFIVKQAWGTLADKKALQGPILGGLTNFLQQYGSQVDDKVLATKLEKYTPTALMALCDTQKLQGASRASGMKDVLVRVWNHNKKIKLV